VEAYKTAEILDALQEWEVFHSLEVGTRVKTPEEIVSKLEDWVNCIATQQPRTFIRKGETK
jgi:hypothetical protein